MDKTNFPHDLIKGKLMAAYAMVDRVGMAKEIYECMDPQLASNKIKNFSREDYGYPDDDYIFLKFFDAGRMTYTHNPKSHKKRFTL